MFNKPVRPRAPSETFLHDEQAAKVVRDKLRFVLEYGVLAPGGHPWMIAIGENAVELRLGHRCDRAAHDRLHRDAIMGCGIGLAQLRLALRQLGCVDSTILLPEESQPDLLARVYIDHVSEESDPQSFVLYQALYAEVSKQAGVMDRAFCEELAAHALQERAMLEFSAPGTLPPSDAAAPCGAPMLGSVVRRLAWMESRVVQSGVQSAVQEGDEVPFTDSVAAVIATKGDKVADWLSAGQALARVALRARVEGLYTRVARAAHGARAAGGAYAQISLRIGVPQRTARPSQAPPAGPFFAPPKNARSA